MRLAAWIPYIWLVLIGASAAPGLRRATLPASAWILIWLVLIVLICVSANIWTGEPIWAINWPHITISGIIGGSVTLVCLAVATVVRWMVNYAKAFGGRNHA